MADDKQEQLALQDEAPVEALPDDFNIAAEADGDFEVALALAGRVAKGILMLDDYEAGLMATLGAEVAEAERTAKALKARLESERSYCDKERTRRMQFIYWGLCHPFREKLPPGKQTIMLPNGDKFHWARVPSKEEWAVDPTDDRQEDLLALDFARSLPGDLLEKAIEVKPTLNKRWLREHISFPEGQDTPVFKYKDPETGEVTELPAVVTRKIGDDPKAFPVIREQPPAEPLRYEVVHPDKRKAKSVVLTTPTPTEEDDDTNE